MVVAAEIKRSTTPMTFATSFSDAVAMGARGYAQASSSVDSLVNEDHIRLAVTGLSRAGKTVFITSLIQNLLALGQRRNTLPMITRRLTTTAGVNRLRSVTVLSAGAALLPSFDQTRNFAALAADPPAWPNPTTDLAQISLAIEVERKSSFGKRLGTRRLRLDILDYPGEWLLDLPMLDQSFATWSAGTLKLLRQPPRRECSEAFLAFLAMQRPEDRVEDSIVRRGHELFSEALEACRSRHGLRYLQPGRFICPGPRSDAPFMWFFPLESSQSTPGYGTVGALLEERFEAYKRDMRLSFFDSHFAAFNRQIMLVDVLGALYLGKAAFEDTARAIQELGRALRYGTNGMAEAVGAGMLRGASQLLPVAFGLGAGTAGQGVSSRIERAVFVATKADHVPAVQRDNLQNLLRDLATGGDREAIRAGVRVSYEVAASILSTQDGTGRSEGRPVQVVQGVKLGESTVRSFHVGDVPSAIPPESFWAERYLDLPVFRPPPIDANGQAGIPHLNLDRVLDAAIGELL